MKSSKESENIRGNLLVLPFDPEDIDEKYQQALKQHIVLQYIMDSSKLKE